MSGTDREHAAAVDRAFTRQAAAFEDPRLNRIFTTDSEWLFERLEVGASDLVLDVAAGTGHVARSLAGRARTVVALDATAAMLETGRERALAAGLDNLVWLCGDAAALPFLDGSFDVVVSRHALHHFVDPRVQLAEIVRCTRRGGRVAIGDLVADPDPATAAIQDRLERLRDPSHARLLTPVELTDALVAAGVEPETLELEARDLERPLEPWLEQTGTDGRVAEAIRSELRAELHGNGPPTGFRPRERDGSLWFIHALASAIGRVSSAACRPSPRTATSPMRR